MRPDEYRLNAAKEECVSTPATDADEVAQRAAKGVLLYIAFLEPREGATGDRSKLRPEHHRFVENLDKQGKLFGSGPVVDEKTGLSDGSSVFVLRAKSLAEAEAIASKEPFVLNGFKSLTVRPWRLVIGETIELARRGR